MVDVSKLDISKFLPHRSPFLMVDKVLSISDNHVSTSFLIKQNNVFVENNLFNEVGLVECAAQTCSSIVGKSYFEDDDLEGAGTKLIGFISKIKSVNLVTCPKVGSTIKADAKLVSRFDADDYTICTLSCKISEQLKELLSCEMNLFIREVKK
ncbi:MAG: ABC transporter permease [Urechidicola sp.]|nr:ABC transporter permease [Urechidicola sp.]